MRTKIFTLAALSVLAIACQKEVDAPTQTVNLLSENIKELEIPANFDYSTAREVEARVSVKNLQGQPLAGVKVSFHTDRPEDGGAYLSSGVANSAGIVEMPVRIPAYVEEVFVQVHQIGFANSQTVAATGNIDLQFGGKPGARDLGLGKAGTVSANPIPISGDYYYMGSFTTGSTAGLPSYLEVPGDVVTQQFLDDVNASLPERAPVPVNNPSYLTVGNELDVVIDDRSDVWVTFVTEGAGFKNALGYYVFDSNNPPATANDIDSIFVVLPNASLDGSGGKLQAGDKVKLGTFEGGKTISWVLFQDAWTGNGVNVNAVKYYSRIDFNTMESDPTLRQHTVQLADIGRQLLLNGFEDQTRSTGSDNDFNDLIFYVTANPWENVNIGGIPPVKPSSDCDNDGVSDDSDDFPCDPARAVRNTYTGTLAYEDLWPSQGDYDFNDLVVDYEVDHILNGANQLVEIESDWTVRAIGAGFRNGFGFAFDGLAPSAVSSVSGQNLNAGLITNNGNGTEQGQSDATIIVFDNAFNVLPNPGTSFVNTVPGQTTVAPETVSNTIVFSAPQVQSQVGLPPYNAFIFANATRGREVHLANKPATDLADASLFGTGADATDPGNEVYYKTANGLPWAINIAEPFAYPQEFAPIDDAYLNFATWATSGGTINTDWFTDAAGNRDASKLY